MLERVKERVNSSRQVAEKRVLRLERALPILVDFAEDRVYFRGLNIALFTLVLLFIIRAGLFIVFLQFPLLQASQQELNLDGELGTSVAFGGSFGEPVKIHVTKTSKRIPVIGRNISLRIELALPDLLQLPVNGFENTITHLSGIALKGSFSIPGFPPKVLETPFVTGTSEVTDINGDAIFRNLRIYTGVPGAYLVTAIDNADGRQTKIGKVQVRSLVTSAVITEDGRKKLEYGRRGLPPRVVTGEPLPRLQVKITGSNKLGIEGKMCVLTSASRETVEFSNVGARPDVFHPRLVIINNPYSTLSDDQGFAEFRNVTFSTTIKHVRLWIVCDGRVANYAGSKDRSLVFTAVRKNAETHALVATILQQPSTEVLEGESLSRQPSLLLQYRSLSTGQLTPATGIVAFAYPFMQAGFKSRNLMSPAGAAELEMLRESEQAVLGNLGRVKQLFNLVSSPSDARGVANFTNLGFIRHGEAGVYTLGFASTGLFDELESNVVTVKTSVAEVTWVSSLFDEQNYIQMAADARELNCSIQDDFFSSKKVCPEIPSFLSGVVEFLETGVITGGGLNQSSTMPPKRIASTICNWPVCRSEWGSSSGFVIYDSSVNILQLRSEYPTFRASPSGALSNPPTLYISDKYGRKLAGKYSIPVTTKKVQISEMPFKGASVSKLSKVQKSYTSLFSDLVFYYAAISSGNPPPVLRGSQLCYHRENLSPNAGPKDGLYYQSSIDLADYITEMRETGEQGSFFRVVSAPHGVTQTTLAFDVEGVRSSSTSLEVYNIDSKNITGSIYGYVAPPSPVSSLCAHIHILQSPSQFRQDGSVNTAIQESTMSLLFLDDTGQEKPFVVQAVNSFGEPVQVDGIGMYAVDALGYVMVTSVGDEHVGLSSSYTSSLRGLGAATLTIGNYSSMKILREHMLAPIVLQNTNVSGHAVFNLTRIRRAQNTWVKFAFVALYADIKAKTYSETDLSINDYYDGAASCVSEYSVPVAINSVVSSVEWDIPFGSPRQFAAFGPSANLSEFAPLPSLPPVRVTASKWAEKTVSTGSSFPFVNVLGETDSSFESVPAHVAVTSSTFERDVSSIEYWANSLGGVLSQLDNNIIPDSFSESDFIKDIYQVSSITSSVSSTLGLQLRRWSTSLGNDENSTFVQIAARPSTFFRDRSGTVTASAILPRVSSTRGNVGVYNFVAFSGGVSGSESIEVLYKDDINAIVIVDHSSDLSGLCPPPVVVKGVERPQRDDLACQGSPTCSGHGECVCGVCICADGYDGAEDCSVKYEEDDFGTFFSKDDIDSYYKGKYGGLPVYDAQKGMRTLGYYAESFPRIIFPAIIGVGSFLDGFVIDENDYPLAQRISKSENTIKDKNEKENIVTPIPDIMRVKDIVNDAWTASAGLDAMLSFTSLTELDGFGFYEDIGIAFNKLSLAKGSTGYRAFPILYTCAGNEVYGWWFTPSWSRCSYDQVQVFADSYYDDLKDRFLKSTFNISMPSGVLSFDHYNLQNVYDFNVFADDHRLFLGGLKSGCYRFKWAYAPQGSGSREYRRLDDPEQQSQVVSLGYSRPFRALGVIDSMIVNQYDKDFYSRTVSRGVNIEFTFTLLLQVRKHTDSFRELQDFCSDDAPNDFDDARSSYRKYAPLKSSQRCKDEKSGGLDVTVSAVHVSTLLEYSLYVPSQSFDCSRAYLDSSSSSTTFDTYQARFDQIQFPSIVNLPPGPGSQFYTEASEIPTGIYRLRFRAYGDEVMTDDDFFVVLVDEPKALVSKSYEGGIIEGNDFATDAGNLRLVPDYFSNSSVLGVSKACYDRTYKVCDYSGGVICFPDDCYEPEYYNELSIWTKGSSNVTCLKECTHFFQSEITMNFLNISKKFSANVSEIGSDNRYYPKWFGVIPKYANDVPSETNPPVRGSLIEAEIVYSPPRSNAVLSPTTTSQITSTQMINEEEKVCADFSSLLFESGISGLYILRFSVNTRDPVDPGFLLFDVTNPIQEVKVFFNNVPLSRITTSSYASASASSRLIESTKLAQLVRICIIPSSGRSIQALSSSNSVDVRLLSDPTPSAANTQNRLQAPTKKGDGLAWEAMLNAIAGKRQRFVYAEESADEDRNDVVAGFTAFARSASNGTRTFVDPRSKGTPLGNDGCVEFSELSFNAIGFTQRVAVVFSVLGVEGPPLILDLVTLLDANPVTTESLQNQIIIPLVIMMPAFGANSQLVDFKTRFICLVLSFVGLAIIASTSGTQFFTSLADFYKAFSQEDVQYVYILSVAWWVCYAVVIAYLSGVTIAFIYAVYTFYKDSNMNNRSVMSVRERKASTSSFLASLSTTSSAFDMTNSTKQGLSGFFETHMRASIAYTRRLLPRIRVPIEEVVETEHEETEISTPAEFQIKPRSVFAGTMVKPSAKMLVTKPSLKERLQQTLRYILLGGYHLLTSFESSYEAFFYPQRLIISALVSLICCLFFALLFVYGSSHLSTIAKTALDEFLEREAAAIQTAKTKILLALDATKSTLSSELSSSSVTAITSDLEQAFFKDAVDGVLDQIITETEKSAFGFSIPSNLASQLRSISNSSIIQSEDPAAEIIRAQRAIAEPWIDASIKNLRSSVSFGLSSAAIVVTIVWLDFLIVYKRVILAVRRGNVTDLPSYFSWFPDRAAISAAPTFVGIQAIGTMLSFLIFSLIFTLLSFLLSAKIVQDFLVSKALSFIGWAAFSAILINFLRVALLKHIATSGGNISLRALFSFLDIYFMFFNLITGAAVALVRFLILIPFYFILIMRPDIQALPNDPATAAYCSVVLIDARYNNPIGKCVHEILRKILEDVRRRRLEKRRSSRDLRSIVLNPMAIVNSQKKTERSQSASSSTASSSSSNSKRNVNRWWLFAMLSTHPVLRRYRHREEEEKIIDGPNIIDSDVDKNGGGEKIISSKEKGVVPVNDVVLQGVAVSNTQTAHHEGESSISAATETEYNHAAYYAAQYDENAHSAVYDQAAYDHSQAAYDHSQAAYDHSQAAYDQAAYDQHMYDQAMYNQAMYAQATQEGVYSDTGVYAHQVTTMTDEKH